MSSSSPKRSEDLSLVQCDQPAYIDFRLYFFGEIGRPDLIERFSVAPAGVTRDLALHREIMPHNITFDDSDKIYRVGQEFSPLFEYTSLRILSTLSFGFGGGVSGSMRTLLPCESPAALNIPKMSVLATICRGIHAERPVAIRYHSMSSGEPKRVIVSFVLVDTSLHWHVWAFDRKSREFRDSIVTRIEEPTLLGEEPQANERPHNDIQRTHIVELSLVPYPSVERPDIIEMNYRMTDDSIRICVRAAVVGCVLQRWRVDCSSDHCLRGSEYRLWLRDHLATYGVKNALLVPGYRATKKADY